MKIYIIGFMGSGKTLYGEELAKELGYKFYDTDVLITNKEGKNINEIFKANGEKYFRQVEHEVLTGLLEENSVISTGGGMPCFHENMNFMNSNGITVFLKTPVHITIDYLKNHKTNRPLIKSLSGFEIDTYVRKTLSSRMKHYRQAALTIDPIVTYPDQLISFLNKL